jgi:hypothetical protein
MIAATIGGPIIMERKIPFIMSRKNNHGVCCRIDDNNVRMQRNMNFTTDKLIRKLRNQSKIKVVNKKGR